jgi:hypothetical protein
MKDGDFMISWIDRHREPQCAPDPAYPNGVDADCSGGAEPSCFAPLTSFYPTPRCGYLYVECRVCGTNAIITTAGRPDDPRSVKLACKARAGKLQ